jgi:hypothetical protein
MSQGGVTFGYAVEFVVQQFLGKPVALVLAEVELLGGRVEINADDLPDAAGDDSHCC